MKKIAIIANGTAKDNEFHRKLLQDFDLIICADGGANIAKELQINPDYIVGDLDSINDTVLHYFKNLNKTKIIKDDTPDKTDLELAIELAETLNPSEITILGAIGDRIDHTLANIYCLDKIKPEIKAEIIDEKNTIKLFKKGTEIIGEKDDTVSVVSLSDVSKLNYSGFKWNVKNLDTKSGWFGISNRMIEDKASISFSDGKILIVKVRK